MATEFQLSGELRDDNGKGASRRLRRHGKLPAILYGAGEKPISLTLDHNELMRQMDHEAFFSHVLTIKVGRKKHQAILKDMQRHSTKPEVMHLDLLRVKTGEAIRTRVPLHFINEETAPGVKAGGIISHHEIDIEIECLPMKLPEFIEVDVGELEIGDTRHLSDLVLPKEATSVALTHGEDYDLQIVSIHHARVSEEPEEEAPEEEAAPEVEAKGKEKAEEEGENGESSEG